MFKFKNLDVWKVSLELFRKIFIAKGSVYEVVSIAHVLRQENLLTAEEYTECYRLCDRIAGMLSGLIAKQRPS